MGSTLSGVIYFGAPIDDYTDYDSEEGVIDKTPSWARRPDPDDEDYDEDVPELEWSDVWAQRKYGWAGELPYADEDDDPKGHEKWLARLREKWAIEKNYEVAIDWCGDLAWDETPKYVYIKASQKEADDGESLLLTTDSIADTERDNWAELLAEFVKVMELPVTEPFGWRLTASRS